MKKFILLLMALLLPLSAFEMSADEKPVIKRIPIKVARYPKLQRDLAPIPLESYFYGPMSCIHTTALTDLGEVEVNVTNNSTGEFWTDTFDTSVESQFHLQISATSGYYVIEYTTASGDIYEGEFIIE